MKDRNISGSGGREYRFVNAKVSTYNWQRPVDFSFEIRDINKPL